MRSLRLTPKAIFPSLISLLRFRPIFPNGCGHHTPIPQVFHSSVQQLHQFLRQDEWSSHQSCCPSCASHLSLWAYHLSSHPSRNSFFFFGHAHGMWKCLGQGSNMHHSRNLLPCSDNAGSLTHCTTREVLFFQEFLNYIQQLSSSPVTANHPEILSTPSV